MSTLATPGDAVAPGDIAASLPALPACMAGHPYGADEAGRPITHVKGPVVVGTVGYMLDCVAQRMAASLPPGTSATEREARIEQARQEAIGQLVERLNAAIPDPLYHVTADYLMDDHHSYSMEFMVFVDGICYELSGDPHYYFESGARSFPSSLTYLVRPFSVTQGYSLVPRVTALFQDTDVRVVHVEPGTAVIQWYASKDTAQVPENLKQRVIFGTCQGLQGVFAQIPRIVAGLLVAKVEERRCILRGDACCEWKFTWQEPRRRGLYRLWPRASQEDILQAEAPEPAPPRSTAPVLSGPGIKKQAPVPTPGSELVQGHAPPARPADPAESAALALPPLPAYMVGHPFGADEAGRPITHTKGHVIRGAVEYMLECVVQRAAASLPAETGGAERETHLARARAAALEALVARLNAAIPDPLYHVSADYLLDDSHSYSTEFDAFACEICRQMSGDPNYHFNRAARTIPASLAYLGRPFSLAQVYKMLPRLVSKVAEADMRPVSAGPGSAVIQYYANKELAELPEGLRQIYLSSACRHGQGALAQIPRIVYGLPVAEVRETHCQLYGDPCCEWEFIWEAPPPRIGVEVLGGALASLFLLGGLALHLLPLTVLAGIAVLLPLAVGLMAWRLKRVSHDRDRQRRLLLEQRESAELHYDELQKASADLQLSNAALQHRLAELTALHEVGLVTGAALDLDKLLDDSLSAVTRNLGFDRALVLLVDEERRLLVDGRLVGGSQEMAAAARNMAVSLDNQSSFLSQAVRLGRPVLVTDAMQAPDEETLRYVQGLKARRFVAVPLLVHGAALGVLAVDNATTDRPVTEDSFELLMTVGNQIAGAIDRVRLYQTLEQRIAQRTAELAQATREAEREKLYSEALIQNSPVAIVATDPAANVVTWNPAAERLFGFAAAEANGRNLDELVASDPAIQPIKAEAVAHSWKETGQAPVHAITQRTRRDGTLVDVEVWVVPVIISGEEARVLALYHDLTETKQAEAALQESHRQLADIINFMPDAVFVIDREGKVIAWNRAIEEMTGTKAEDMLGKGDYEYALPFYGERRPILIDLVTTPRKELEQKYTSIKKEGQILVGETYVPHLKGGGVYLLATASALHDSKGNVVGAIEAIRDFTERKHMEEDLHQAKEAAEAATQAKSAFLATMSHEIRTPMNAVIGMTGLLLDTPLTPEQREFVETIRTSGDALLTIINDILDFSKIEAGRMELESQPFDLRECVESAVDLLAARAAEKGLDLSCVVENDVPAAILGDVTRLRQILVNLLGNAVKFTEQGEVVLSVSVEREAESIEAPSLHAPRATLHFAVRDTGIGIPPERQSRLFQSFSQVDTSTTRRFGGTGLGLAISKRLTELMSGTMWVESEGVAGQGSTFHFTIRAEIAQPLAPRPYLQSIQPGLEGKRVLVVDDNATNRHILSLQTQAWGMLPQDTASPHEALAWIARGDPFDVALLDLQMPQMDGAELAAEIRRLRPAQQLPLVILSSLGQREAKAEGVELAAYLLKPIKPSQLYNVLVGIFGIEGAVSGVEETAKPRFDAEMGRRHPLSILLAEDNTTNQKLALLVLERLGYRADVAGNGIEVLEALRRQAYDVVLMDVQMPEMDGLEATRVIGHGFSAERRPRIVAMTANAMKEDRDECFAAGMDDFMTKPIQFDELVAALNRCQARAVGEMNERPSPAARPQDEKPAPRPQGPKTVPTPPSQSLPDPVPGIWDGAGSGHVREDEPGPSSREAVLRPSSHGETDQARGAAAAGEPAPPVFDPAALQRLRGTLGKQADVMLPGLMDSFFKDAPKLIADAQYSLEKGQATDLRRAAHTLKSGSATFGAMALSALARELEYKARDGALEGADELLTQIQAAFAEAKAALEAQRGVVK
jgi:PAS domain S-box-containing protein